MRYGGFASGGRTVRLHCADHVVCGVLYKPNASAALTLAGLSGVILIAMGVFKLGFLTNFLSHPVIAGFITASGIIIATSQLKHVLGVDASGHNLVELVSSLARHVLDVHWMTLALGVSATLFLFWVRKGLKPLL